MAPLSPCFCRFKPSFVPLVLVGQALEHCHPVGPITTSEWNGRPVQLWKVRVKVEQVLQGELSLQVFDVFYFVDQGAYDGSMPPLLDIAAEHSEIFFLEKDGPTWRTVCDGWRSCVHWVRTGTHYRYKPDLSLPLETVINELLISRGDQTSDQQMVDALYHLNEFSGWEMPLAKLQQLATSDASPQVRSAASAKLRYAERRLEVTATTHQ